VLTAEENERLTRVGPGTPMGSLMRCYWMPVAPAAVLNEDPVRKVKILGEELVLYRDRSGGYGLIGPRCAHRLVHMQFGIPEDNGLRCPYHGWCYDKTGQCIDTPFEPEHSKLKQGVQISGYPVQELGGLLWAYLGKGEPPIIPPWDFLVWPNSIRQIAVSILPCNWLQCHENSADPFHGKYLHGHFFKYQLEKLGLLEERAGDQETHLAYAQMRSLDGHGRMFFRRDAYGFQKGIQLLKKNGAEKDIDKFWPYNIFPFYSRNGGGFRCGVNVRVPLDDTRTYHLQYMVYHVPGVEAPEQPEIPYFNVPLNDEHGRPILDTVAHQDWAAWYSQGEITDRTKERLASTDYGVMQFRKMLQEQMAIVEQGGDPMNVFRDRAAVGDCITLSPAIGSDGEQWRRGIINRPTDKLQDGYWRDFQERFDGPANDLVFELMCRALQIPANA
jgi:5,5'-dehydrodivanillate O-demethylase